MILTLGPLRDTEFAADVEDGRVRSVGFVWLTGHGDEHGGRGGAIRSLLAAAAKDRPELVAVTNVQLFWEMRGHPSYDQWNVAALGDGYVREAK